MAKKKSKAKKKKKQKGWSTGSVVAAGLAGEVLGNALSLAVNQAADKYLNKGSKKKGAEGDAKPDVATRLLRSLAERGPLSIPDLLERTAAPLAKMLRSLQDLREFRLVEFVGDDDRVQLTPVGSRTATVLGKASIRRSAAAVLEK
jgi:hypothetical protein